MSLFEDERRTSVILRIGHIIVDKASIRTGMQKDDPGMSETFFSGSKIITEGKLRNISVSTTITSGPLSRAINKYEDDCSSPPNISRPAPHPYVNST
jgi:hypothetical protein